MIRNFVMITDVCEPKEISFTGRDGQQHTMKKVDIHLRDGFDDYWAEALDDAAQPFIKGEYGVDDIICANIVFNGRTFGSEDTTRHATNVYLRASVLVWKHDKPF